MYQKSVNAGSQSDISRRGSSLADMNGNGHTSEMSEALNVNVVTYVSQSYDDLGKHKGNHHSVGDKSIQETNGKHCMHNQNMVRFQYLIFVSVFSFSRNCWTSSVNHRHRVINLPPVQKLQTQTMLKRKRLRHSRPNYGFRCSSEDRRILGRTSRKSRRLLGLWRS